MKTITKTQLREHIAKLVAEQVKSLSPEAQKALELSRQAKLNKDAQKKRAAAKDSMKGISVEAVDPLDEQSGATQDIATRKLRTAQSLSLEAGTEVNALLHKIQARIMNLVDDVEFNQGWVTDLYPIFQDFEYLGFMAVTSEYGEVSLKDLVPVGGEMRQLGEQSSPLGDKTKNKFYTAIALNSEVTEEINAQSSRIMSLVKGIKFTSGYVKRLEIGVSDDNFVYGFDAIMSTGELVPFEDLVLDGPARVSSKNQLGEQSSWHRNQNGELADLYKTKYRVNFGQGQVSNTFPTRKEAEYEMTFLDEPNAFIQYKDLNTGEWFNIKHLKEQRIEGDKRHSDEMDFFDTDEFHDEEYDLDNGIYRDADGNKVRSHKSFDQSEEVYVDDEDVYGDFDDHVELGEPDSGSYDLYDDMSDDDLDRRY